MECQARTTKMNSISLLNKYVIAWLNPNYWNGEKDKHGWSRFIKSSHRHKKKMFHFLFSFCIFAIFTMHALEHFSNLLMEMKTWQVFVFFFSYISLQHLKILLPTLAQGIIMEFQFWLDLFGYLNPFKSTPRKKNVWLVLLLQTYAITQSNNDNM